MTLDELYEDFEWIGDDLARAKAIIDLGRDLDPLPDHAKTEANLVAGCTSQVWMAHAVSDDRPPRLRFTIGADAHIVRGLAAILLLGMNDKPAQEILNFDLDEVFTRLNLRAQLTPSRQNGVLAIANKMKAVAKAVAEAG